MGTTISVECEGNLDDTTRVEQIFDGFDRRFSLYRDDSELSRIAAGSLELVDSSDALREVYALALEWRLATGGIFTPHRPDGVIDLNGVVKALAMERSGETLGTNWIVNAGGDILISGVDRVVGIVDPVDRGTLLCSIVLAGRRRAMATSGSAERGDHIWGRSPEFAQATVVADDIITADVLATAIIAGGSATLDDVTARFDVDVLTVDRDGQLRATPGIRTALATGQPGSAQADEPL
jgi:thiamine biosynthesis lipoprotein